MNLSLRRMLLSELVFWLALCGVGLYFLLPLRESLRFGIDLAGGTYLELEVQTDKAVEAELIEQLQAVDSRLKRVDKAVPTNKIVENNVLALTFSTIQDAQLAADVLKGELSEMTVSTEEKVVKLQFPDRVVQRIKKEAVDNNTNVLRMRMLDIPIASQGEKNIIVELPDVVDPQKARAQIGKSAQLEFRLVDKQAPSKDDILYEYDGELPADKEILPGQTEGGGYYLVEKYAQVTGKMLKKAWAGEVGIDRVVNFQLNDSGAAKFYEITSKGYGRQLAIVLDDVVISAPRIDSPIKESGYIRGRFTSESAKELASLLRSGAFVAPVKFVLDRHIGPTLGAESIQKGLVSCLIGLGLLFIFALFYYSLSGLFAFSALLYNLGLILLGLAYLKTPLTLPGIAGMVLTVGMAIDASILIFERIKEELARGVTVAQAVNSGFSGVMMVILDANITTFIVGIVLYQFGTGPIQGFAVTMMLGIIATLVTGLFFLRSLFKFVISNFHIQKLRI